MINDKKKVGVQEMFLTLKFHKLVTQTAVLKLFKSVSVRLFLVDYMFYSA